MKTLLIRLSSVVLVILLFLQLVKNTHFGEAQTITAPINKVVPIRGEWVVERYNLPAQYSNEKNSLPSWIGKKVFFSEDIAILGDETCLTPQYKVKTLDTGSYLLNTYNASASDLGVQNKEIDIVSVTSSDKHFYDFLRLDENHLVFYAEKTFMYLTKVSESINSGEVAERLKNMGTKPAVTQSSRDPLLRSGVLLGLRSAGTPVPGKTDILRPSYRTLWIAAKNKATNPVMETAGLLVPRINGFWKVNLKSQYIDNYLEESITAYSLETMNRGAAVLREEEKKTLPTNTVKNILFVGNDYISLEYGEGTDINNVSCDKLQMVPIDKPENGKKVKLSEIEGDNGKNALISSAKAFITSSRDIKAEELQKEPQEDNFAMVRRNGHWILRGRLEYLNPAYGKRFEDFTLNLLPSRKIVNYDELAIAWNAIKERVPDALDAYTSPNRDIVIVISKNSIYVYGIENSALAVKPLEQLKIQEGESVIMAEWATGEYVDRWEKTMGQDSQLVDY